MRVDLACFIAEAVGQRLTQIALKGPLVARLEHLEAPEHADEDFLDDVARVHGAASAAGQSSTGPAIEPGKVAGAEQLDGKGQALSNLAHLLYHRHAHELRTVVTLNMTKAAFGERYARHDGGRLRDRFAEAAWFVELTGTSLRRRLVLEEDAT